MSPLRAAEEALLRQVRTHGEDIVLVLENGTRVPLKAHIGRSDDAQRSPAPSNSLPQVTLRTVDFIVPTADLNARAITRGCRVEFNGRKYVPASAGGEPLVGESGRFGLLSRIHTVS